MDLSYLIISSFVDGDLSYFQFFSFMNKTLQTFVYKFLCETASNSTKLELLYHNGTPLQYSCLENPMDGGAW